MQGKLLTSRQLLSACVALAALLLSAHVALGQRRGKRAAAASASASASSKSITVKTEPNAVVWLDEVRRGVTGAEGSLTLEKVSAGRHSLRVRANGFKERSLALTPAQRGEVEVRLTETTDEAELTFQRAEEAREKARDEESKRAAVELYRRAIELRPSMAAAHIGLARVLLDMNDYKKALAEIDEARRYRAVYPEASAVEGRILRYAAFWDDAIAAFKRAIREGRGFQPEAHTGLGLLYEEKGMDEEAAAEFRAALNQLSDSEPVVYQLLGAAYEKQEKYKEAVEAYEKYLELAPAGSMAEAIRSVIDQLRRQAEEGQSNPPY